MTEERKPGFDGNPPEFAATRDIESVDRLTGRRVRERIEGPTNINTTRIRWLYEHGHLGKQEGPRRFAAAEAYAGDHERAQLLPVANLVSALPPGAGGYHDCHPNDAKLTAMKRKAAAATALGRWRPVVDLIVIDNKTLSEAARLLGNIHQQRIAERLETGLDVLAEFYGIGKRARSARPP